MENEANGRGASQVSSKENGKQPLQELREDAAGWCVVIYLFIVVGGGWWALELFCLQLSKTIQESTPVVICRLRDYGGKRQKSY